jgi:hypothetical protein
VFNLGLHRFRLSVAQSNYFLSGEKTGASFGQRLL